MDAISGSNIFKTFRLGAVETVQALVDVTFNIRHGTLTALVGPDGAGKTTLLRMVAGLMSPNSGRLEVLGLDVATNPQAIQSRISYMPQKFGLYEDLSVQENLDLYADLHGVSRKDRSERYPRLMDMTNLAPFMDRLAGRLSGGMKQKLGLACTLVRSPDLLLLDEPTVGVDPLSRRELWEIIRVLVKEEKLTVLMSTSYLDEAERCNHAIVLNSGKILVQGPPEEVSSLATGRVFLADPLQGQPARNLQARLFDAQDVADAVPEGGQVRLVRQEQGQPPFTDTLAGLTLAATPTRFEDGFMLLLHKTLADAHVTLPALSPTQATVPSQREVVIEVHDLVRKFGAFTAVDHVSFEVNRGEIFGLLGPNGAGKTTTFRMLCGLLVATSGKLRVAGEDLRIARASARKRIGYVAWLI